MLWEESSIVATHKQTKIRNYLIHRYNIMDSSTQSANSSDSVIPDLSIRSNNSGNSNDSTKVLGNLESEEHHAQSLSVKTEKEDDSEEAASLTENSSENTEIAEDRSSFVSNLSMYNSLSNMTALESIVEGHSGTQQQQQRDSTESSSSHPPAFVRRNKNRRFSSRITTGLRSAGSTGSRVSRRGSLYVRENVRKNLHPKETKVDDFAWRVFMVFAFLQVVVVFGGCCVLWSRYPTLLVTCPATILAVLILYMISRFLVYHEHLGDSDDNDVGFVKQGERLLAIFLMVLTLGGFAAIQFVATSPCSHCIYWTHRSMSVSGGSDQAGFETTNRNTSGVLWDLFLSQDDAKQDPESLMGSCRSCAARVATFIQKPYEYLFPPKELDIEALAKTEEELFNISTVQSSTSTLGDLARWYIYHINQTTPLALELFNRKIFSSISDGGRFNDEDIERTLNQYLCSPASRIDSPDPNRFLTDMKRPRFTGEKPLNISASALQAIMRGDPLKKIGTNICFMLRFALLVPTDADLEAKPIKYTQLFPSMNEQGMRSRDFTSGLPFLVNPGWDQDIDLEGKGMDQFANAMSIFSKSIHIIIWCSRGAT